MNRSEAITVEKQCEECIYGDGGDWFVDYQCRNAAVVFRDGRWLCEQHDLMAMAIASRLHPTHQQEFGGCE